MIYLLLDILIYNYTSYYSFFFLINIISKNYLYLFTMGFILDFIIFHTWGFNIIFLTIFYLIRKSLKINNFIKYYLFLIITILIYYFLSHLIFNYLNFYIIGQIFLLNSIFILISYKNYNCHINLIG